MGTPVKVQSSYYGNTKVASYYYYTISETDTSYTLTLYGGIYIGEKWLGGNFGTVTCTISGTSQTNKSNSTTYGSSTIYNAGDYQIVNSYSWTWSKTKATQSVTIKSICSSPTMGGSTNYASKTFTIPAKTAYVVTYNANGGSGAPSNQTKWYGENLTLQTGVPTKTDTSSEHYTFMGWATSQANANNKVVSYKPGATYTGNAALTLFAVWDVSYVPPTIGKITSLRSKSNGTADDEGTYLNISFPWSVDRAGYLTNTGQSVKLEYKQTTASSWTTIGTYAISGASGTFSKTALTSGAFNVDNAYNIRITLTDAHGSTVTQDILSGSFFIMDVSENGYGIGFGCAAPEPATRDDATMKINMDLKIGLKYSGTPGSATGDDADLVNALSALGWTDCIE